MDDLKKIILRNELKKNILIIGMGGSVLGSKMISSFFGLNKNYFFLDSLNHTLINDLIKKDLTKFSIFVISKSGTTLETLTNFNIILDNDNIKGIMKRNIREEFKSSLPELFLFVELNILMFVK